MLLVSNALTYPLGTYHYCLDGVHVAISGFEKHLRVEKVIKKPGMSRSCMKLVIGQSSIFRHILVDLLILNYKILIY